MRTPAPVVIACADCPVGALEPDPIYRLTVAHGKIISLCHAHAWARCRAWQSPASCAYCDRQVIRAKTISSEYVYCSSECGARARCRRKRHRVWPIRTCPTCRRSYRACRRNQRTCGRRLCRKKLARNKAGLGPRLTFSPPPSGSVELLSRWCRCDPPGLPNEDDRCGKCGRLPASYQGDRDACAARQTGPAQRMARSVDSDQAPTLTFDAFARATRGLPPSAQLAAFLRLPRQFQEQAWTALRVEFDAEDDLATAA